MTAHHHQIERILLKNVTKVWDMVDNTFNFNPYLLLRPLVNQYYISRVRNLVRSRLKYGCNV